MDQPEFPRSRRPPRGRSSPLGLRQPRPDGGGPGRARRARELARNVPGGVPPGSRCPGRADRGHGAQRLEPLATVAASRRTAHPRIAFRGRPSRHNAAHFGYRHGFSQPTIEGLPLAGLPDRLPRAPVGEFLLGYPSQHSLFTYPIPFPPELGRNGSCAPFRVLAQDVDGFAEFLRGQSARTGMPEELIAAKLCGRWRNGTPLVVSPDTDTPDPPIAAEAMNDFDSVGSYGDESGLRCPVGARARPVPAGPACTSTQTAGSARPQRTTPGRLRVTPGRPARATSATTSGWTRRTPGRPSVTMSRPRAGPNQKHLAISTRTGYLSKIQFPGLGHRQMKSIRHSLLKDDMHPAGAVAG
jgi:hypothetical protein